MTYREGLSRMEQRPYSAVLVAAAATPITGVPRPDTSLCRGKNSFRYHLAGPAIQCRIMKYMGSYHCLPNDINDLAVVRLRRHVNHWVLFYLRCVFAGDLVE